jgi:hypothetical protein
MFKLGMIETWLSATISLIEGGRQVLSFGRAWLTLVYYSSALAGGGMLRRCCLLHLFMFPLEDDFLCSDLWGCLLSHQGHKMVHPGIELVKMLLKVVMP